MIYAAAYAAVYADTDADADDAANADLLNYLLMWHWYVMMVLGK